MTTDRGDPDEEISQRLGALLVRAWLHDKSLVARVTSTPDVRASTPVTLVITNPRQLYREVARWLDELGVSDTENLEPEGD